MGNYCLDLRRDESVTSRKWIAEESQMIATLNHMCYQHYLFTIDPDSTVMAAICSNNVEVITFLFNQDPRAVPYLIENVIRNNEQRANWGRILFEELTSSK